MSRVCDLCKRGANSAISRSHSNVATKRRQHINLQKKNLAGQKVKVCTRCMRTLSKKPS